MLVTVVAAKGAPGVTTTASALAAVGADQRAKAGEGQRVDLVELDPYGGDVEPFTQVMGEAGLLRAVTDLRTETLEEHAIEAPPGVRSVLAPTSGFEATSTIAAGRDAWSRVLSTLGGVVVVDAGRWEQSHPLAGRVAGSDVVAVLCRPDARSVEHVRHVVPRLRGVVGRVVLVTVGDRPYPPGEIARFLGLPTAGSVSWDPHGAAALWREGIRRRPFGGWTRSWLARSARDVLASLIRLSEEVPVP